MSDGTNVSGPHTQQRNPRNLVAMTKRKRRWKAMKKIKTAINSMASRWRNRVPLLNCAAINAVAPSRQAACRCLQIDSQFRTQSE